MSMVEVVIDSIRISLTEQYRLLVLKETGTDRHLLIYIAQEIADVIHYKLQDVVVPRPLTHDLLHNLITEMGGKISHIVVSDIQDSTFFAKIVIDVAGAIIEVDSRPSDAIALAVRAGVKLFVDEAIMDQAAITPDEALDLETGEASASDDDIQIDEGDLDIFRDFVDSLNLDDLG